MEKQKNGWYKAVSIIEYILASILVFCVGIVLIAGLADPAKFAEGLNQAQIEDLSGNIMYFTADSARNFALTSLVAVPEIIVMYFVAVKFGKYSNLTDKEAAETYKSAVAWTIVSFFFGGTLIGIFALVGLLKNHSKQKERYNASINIQNPQVDVQMKSDAESQAEKQSQVVSETVKVSDEEDKTQQRLAKLESLKASGAITDEEYAQLKNEILKK